MLVSLFSDASICHLKRVGGWAAWLKSDRGAIRTGDHFRTTINDTTIAEAMAAVNGLVAGINTGVIIRGDRCIVATDNNAVMSVLEGTATRKISKAVQRRRKIGWGELRREARYYNAEIKLVSGTFQHLVQKYELAIEWRWVKGHRGKSDKRSAVNSFCDEVARTHMRTARKRRIKPRDHSKIFESQPNGLVMPTKDRKDLH